MDPELDAHGGIWGATEVGVWMGKALGWGKKLLALDDGTRGCDELMLDWAE